MNVLIHWLVLLDIGWATKYHVWGEGDLQSCCTRPPMYATLWIEVGHQGALSILMWTVTVIIIARQWLKVTTVYCKLQVLIANWISVSINEIFDPCRILVKRIKIELYSSKILSVCPKYSHCKVSYYVCTDA